MLLAQSAGLLALTLSATLQGSPTGSIPANPGTKGQPEVAGMREVLMSLGRDLRCTYAVDKSDRIFGSTLAREVELETQFRQLVASIMAGSPPSYAQAQAYYEQWSELPGRGGRMEPPAKFLFEYGRIGEAEMRTRYLDGVYRGGTLQDQDVRVGFVSSAGVVSVVPRSQRPSALQGIDEIVYPLPVGHASGDVLDQLEWSVQPGSMVGKRCLVARMQGQEAPIYYAIFGEESALPEVVVRPARIATEEGQVSTEYVVTFFRTRPAYRAFDPERYLVETLQIDSVATRGSLYLKRTAIWGLELSSHSPLEPLRLPVDFTHPSLRLQDTRPASSGGESIHLGKDLSLWPEDIFLHLCSHTGG